MVAACGTGLRRGLRPAVCPWTCSLCLLLHIASQQNPSQESNCLFAPALLSAIFCFLSPSTSTTSKGVSALCTGRGKCWSLVCFDGCEKVLKCQDYSILLTWLKFPKLCSLQESHTELLTTTDAVRSLINQSFTKPPSGDSCTALILSSLAFPFPPHCMIFIWRLWNFSQKYTWCEAEWPLILERNACRRM